MNRATYDAIRVGDEYTGDLLGAARYALLANLKTVKARWVIGTALDRYGPENVYMDGELWSYR
jgi:uncharacterized protein (DUF39 family)